MVGARVYRKNSGVSVIHTATVSCNSMEAKPRKVYDLFLQREQVRVLTDKEYADKFVTFRNWYPLSSGMQGVTLIVGDMVAPDYGCKEWRG